MRQFISAFSILLLALLTPSRANTETNRLILPYSVVDAVFDPATPRAFVIPHNRYAVDLIDLDTRVQKSLGLNGSPRSMALSPDGTRLYVAFHITQNSGMVAIFDAQQFEFLRQVEVAISPSDIVATDSGLIIISSDRSPPYVRVFESEHGNQVGTSSLVSPRLVLALNPILGFVYASDLSPDGVHHHLAFSTAGAITSEWQVPFYESIYNNKLFVFPDGSRALSGSGHVLTSTTNEQSDLTLIADTDVNFVYSASFETNQNQIVLRTLDRVHFVDAANYQQIESRRISGLQFIGAYNERTAAIVNAPVVGGSEIRWLLPKPASASENLPPTALLATYNSGTVLPVDSLLSIGVHPRDADSEITSTRIFLGTNQIGVRSEVSFNQEVRIRPGTNEIYAVVTDSYGATGTSAVHRVFGNYFPELTVSLIQTGFPEVRPVTIPAKATDRDGEIVSVRLFHNEQVIAQDSTAPYEFVFTPPIPGTYYLQLEAEDNLGGTTRIAVPPLVFRGGTDDFQKDLFVFNTSVTNLLFSGSNTNATRQKGEPLHAGVEGGKSIWWAYRVPTSAGGMVSIDTIGSDFDTLLAVYSAGIPGTNDITQLNLLAANDDDITHAPASKVKFFAPGGHILYIAVDGREGVAGNVKLRINFAANIQLLPNDNFLSARSTISGDLGTNVGATKEPGELDHAGNPGGASVWWRLPVTSANLRPYRISTMGSGFDTLLAVYTTNFPPRVFNATITNLTLVAANDDGNYNTRTSDLTFMPPKPGNYWIAVDGYNGAEGAITLTIVPLSSGAPTNDHFASASLLIGSSILTNGHTITATLEPNEPIHAGKTSSASVWFKWTAPTSGLVTLSTRTSAFDTILAVYKGTNLTSLTPIASNDDDPGNPPTSAVSFHATQGTEYFIAVAGYGFARGEFVLALNQSPGFSPRLQTEWSRGKIVLNSIDAPATTLLESSTNLVDWQIVDTLTALEKIEIAPNFETPQRFYRLHLLDE